MHCFYHPNVSAVAVCKACQRALCYDCAVSLPNAETALGMACKNRCENEVNEVNRLIQKNKKLTSSALGQIKTNAIIYYQLAIGSLALGIVFIGYGGYVFIVFADLVFGSFFGLTGLVFLWLGGSYWQTAQRVQHTERTLQ